MTCFLAEDDLAGRGFGARELLGGGVDAGDNVGCGFDDVYDVLMCGETSAARWR